MRSKQENLNKQFEGKQLEDPFRDPEKAKKQYNRALREISEKIFSKSRERSIKLTGEIKDTDYEIIKAQIDRIELENKILENKEKKDLRKRS